MADPLAPKDPMRVGKHAVVKPRGVCTVNVTCKDRPFFPMNITFHSTDTSDRIQEILRNKAGVKDHENVRLFDEKRKRILIEYNKLRAGRCYELKVVSGGEINLTLTAMDEVLEHWQLKELYQILPASIVPQMSPEFWGPNVWKALGAYAKATGGKHRPAMDILVGVVKERGRAEKTAREQSPLIAALECPWVTARDVYTTTAKYLLLVESDPFDLGPLLATLDEVEKEEEAEIEEEEKEDEDELNDLFEEMNAAHRAPLMLINWGLDEYTAVLPVEFAPRSSKSPDEPRPPHKWSANMVHHLASYSALSKNDHKRAMDILARCVNDRRKQGSESPYTEALPMDIRRAMELYLKNQEEEQNSVNGMDTSNDGGEQTQTSLNALFIGGLREALEDMLGSSTMGSTDDGQENPNHS